MSQDDKKQETHDRPSRQKRKSLFHLPEGTRITFEGFGRRTEVDPDSPQGDLAVLGLIACIVFQAVVAVLGVTSSSGGIQTAGALVTGVAFVVIFLLIVAAFRGSGQETSTSLMRVFCVLVLVGIVLSLIQNRDNPYQVVTSILAIVMGVYFLRRL